MKKSVTKEIRLLSQISNTEKDTEEMIFGQGHPNIMKLYDAIDTTKQLYLICENVEGDMLQKIMQKAENKRLTERQCAKIFK